MAPLPSKPRNQLTPAQAEIHDQFAAVTSANFGPSSNSHEGRRAQHASMTVYQNDEGAFIGPYPFFMAVPSVGMIILQLLTELTEQKSLPMDARETAVLVAVAKLESAYPVYAHSIIPVKMGLLGQEQVAAIKAGKKPKGLKGLNEGCDVAYDVAKSLVNSPGALPQELWERSVNVLGQEATVVLLHFLGIYMYLGMAMNAADVPAPE